MSSLNERIVARNFRSWLLGKGVLKIDASTVSLSALNERTLSALNDRCLLVHREWRGMRMRYSVRQQHLCVCVW